jgi:prepilin-type N-terminal cleavage/methylation domain-containing protein
MKRRSAFTLVEILVVIGIIAVMIAMLLPALSKARIMAQRTADLANLRQCGIALTMYANDWKRYPVSCYEAGNYPPGFPQPVLENLIDTRSSAIVKYDFRVGMATYVKDWRVFFCTGVELPWDPNRTVPIPAPPQTAMFGGYVMLFGPGIGANGQYLLKPHGYWASGDGKKRRALMSDKLYYSQWQNLTLLNHPEKARVTYESNAGPYGSYNGYWADYYIAGKVVHPRFWGATLFSDGSVAGANQPNLVEVLAPTPHPAFVDRYWLVDR